MNPKPTAGALPVRTTCWFTHNWVDVGYVTVVIDKAGPYDPRTDEQRTRQKWKSVCADCGRVRVVDCEW